MIGGDENDFEELIENVAKVVTKNYDYFLLAAALISVGAILVLSDTCYRYPLELRWLENSNAVGVIGIISGLLLIYWAAIPYEKPLLISTALVLSVFFWSSAVIFELFP